MTNYKQGDIVLLEFKYSQEIGSKKRPAVILSNEHYHQSRSEVVVAAVTSNTQRLLAGDTKINKWEEADLLFPSVVTAILRTVKNMMILKKLGHLHANDFHDVKSNLKKCLNF
jgi:mRNA interferase MazF